MYTCVYVHIEKEYCKILLPLAYFVYTYIIQWCSPFPMLRVWLTSLCLRWGVTTSRTLKSSLPFWWTACTRTWTRWRRDSTALTLTTVNWVMVRRPGWRGWTTRSRTIQSLWTSSRYAWTQLVHTAREECDLITIYVVIETEESLWWFGWPKKERCWGGVGGWLL